jgi:hypothetical protein
MEHFTVNPELSKNYKTNRASWQLHHLHARSVRTASFARATAPTGPVLVTTIAQTEWAVERFGECSFHNP